jgi:hypothetical protein
MADKFIHKSAPKMADLISIADSVLQKGQLRTGVAIRSMKNNNRNFMWKSVQKSHLHFNPVFINSCYIQELYLQNLLRIPFAIFDTPTLLHNCRGL